MPRATSADRPGRSQEELAERRCIAGDDGWAQGGARERFVVLEAARRLADLLPIEVERCDRAGPQGAFKPLAGAVKATTGARSLKTFPVEMGDGAIWLVG